MAAAALYPVAARRCGWCFSVLGLSGLLRSKSRGPTLALRELLDLVDRNGWRTSHGLALLGWGAAVYLYFDVAGYGLVFDSLGSGVEIPYDGLRFDPAHRLEGPEGGRLGFIYRFAPTGAPGTSREG